MKNFIWIIGLLLAGCGTSSEKGLPPADEPIPVRVAEVKQEVIFDPVQVSGSFTTDDEAIRSFKTGGIIQRLLVAEGDAIREGQVLATLDMTEIKAQVAQASLAFDKARRDFNRVSNLYRDSVVTREMFENAETALKLAEEQLTAARFNQSHSEIRATEDGFVLRKFVNEGQVVGPGTPVFQTNGAGSGDWILRVAVSDRQWSALAVGDIAQIKSDVNPEKALPGKVSKKSEGVDPYSGTFTVDIRPDGSMKSQVASGMFGRATITPSAGRAVWKIPYDALLDGNGNSGYLFLACNGQRATRQMVSIAGLHHDYVLVEAGLEQCNRVIITGSAYLTDQSPITIIH